MTRRANTQQLMKVCEVNDRKPTASLR
jgi:hypothetical protein